MPSSVLEQVCAAFAARFPGAARSIAGGEYIVYNAGGTLDEEPEIGTTVAAVTMVVERRIEAASVTAPTDSEVNDTIADLIALGTGDRTLGGLADTVRATAFSYAERQAGSRYLAAIVEFSIRVPWDADDPYSNASSAPGPVFS